MSSKAMAQRLMAPALAVAIAFPLGACVDTEPEPTEEAAFEDSEILEDPEVVETPTEENLDDTMTFFNDPAALVGQQVTINAVVADVVDPKGFRMMAHDPSGERLLVVHDGDVQLQGGDMVEVTGTVMEFNMSVVENEMGVDLPKKRYEVYEGEYGIEAQVIDDTVE